jgi:hypothetical protein
MFRVGAADYTDNAEAFDDSAIFADQFHGSFHFHGFSLLATGLYAIIFYL